MFQPTDISGCLFWLKPEGISANSSNRISGWVNNGYQSCTFLPNVNAATPDTIVPLSLNGYNVMRANSPDGLSTGLINELPQTNNVTAIYLYKQAAASVGADAQYLFRGPENSSELDDIRVFYSLLQLNNIWIFGSHYNSHAGFPGYLNDWIIRSDIVDNNMVTFKRNGFAYSSGTITTPLPDISAPPFNGQGSCTVGSFVGVGSGEIAEVVVYDNRISNANVTKVENYLKYKYFVAGVASTPLFTHGSNTGQSGQYSPKTTLHLECVPASSTTPLYIGSAYTIGSGFPLYTAGVPVSGTGTTLYMNTASPASSSGTMYTLGNTPNTSGISLYTHCGTSFNSNVLLYINAAPSYSGQTTLFIHGRTLSDGIQPFYIQGLQNLSANNNTALFIATNTSSANSGVYSLYESRSLYTAGASDGTSFNLYIKAKEQGDDSAGLPLFINTYYPTTANSTDMFIQNSNVMFSGQTKMFIKGLGDLDGGLNRYDNMNLYIERWPAGETTLFINSSITPSSTTLYTCSANSFSSGTSLITTGGQQLMGTGNFPFYVNAGFIQDNNVSMYTHGLPSSNNNSILYTNGF